MDNEYGLTFPIILHPVENEVGELVVGPAKPGLEDALESSLRIILAYQYGERDFLFEFGTILNSLIGAPNDDMVPEVVSIFVVKAIARWEQRLLEVDGKTEQINEYLTINITGKISGMNRNFNYQIIA